LFVTQVASAQLNFGVVQGRIAEGTVERSVVGKINPIRIGTSLGLVVPVSVNGSKPTWWVTDTGGPICLIDPSFSKKLGLQADSNVGRFPMTIVNDFQVGNFRCDGVACAVRSIEAFKSLALMNEGGTLEKTGSIGVNLLARYGGLINCRTQQIFFSPSGNLGMSRQKYEQMGYTYVPMILTPGNRLEVTGALGGKELKLFLDTGAFSSTLDDSIRNELKLPVRAGGAVNYPFVNDKKGTKYSYATATDFKVGTYDAKGARLGFQDLSFLNSGSTRGFAGFLAMDFLFYRSAIIDVGGRALYLKEYSRAR